MLKSSLPHSRCRAIVLGAFMLSSCGMLLWCSPARAVDWLGGTGNWSDPFFWDTGFVPGPGEDVWINVAGGSEVNFDVPSATVAELRLGNGEDGQVFNIPAGTLTLTGDSLGTEDSWSGRWSNNTTTHISGTGKIEVTNVNQEQIPYYIAGDQGPGGDQNFMQNAQFLVEGNGQFIVGDGGAPLDGDGNATAGTVNVAQWREARATVTVRDNGLVDVAGDLQSNSGGWTLNQEGGTINVGVSFYLDRFDPVDGQGAPAEGNATISGGNLNVGWNFHVVQNGKGAFTVTDQGQLDVDNVLKVNDVFPGAVSSDGDGSLSITENGLVTTRFLEVPTSAQLVNDVASLDISGGLLIIEDTALETTTGPLGESVSNPIADDVAAWISSGFLSGSLGTVNRTPSVAIPSISTMGDLAWGRADVADGGALYIWTEAIVATDDADFDGDGDVDIADLMTFQAGYGLVGQTDNSNGDANGDGTVGPADLAVWNNQFGTGEPASIAVHSVPEPGTLACLSVLAVAGLRRFRP